MAQKKVLVMGGGAAGIHAALSEAAAGNKVYLVERFPSIGGERISRDRIITDGDVFNASDVAAIKSHENIKVLTSAEPFDSYEEAEAYLSGQESDNYRIVGDNPFVSSVPLEALKHYRLIHSSDSARVQPGGDLVPTIKIFEYVE